MNELEEFMRWAMQHFARGTSIVKQQERKVEVKTMYRQGDVLLVKVNETAIPAHAKEVERDNGRIVLAYGEVTGHAHAIKAPEAGLVAARVLNRLNEEERFLTVKQDVTLEHEEHAPITLKKGTYKVIRQREYDPTRDRYVAD